MFDYVRHLSRHTKFGWNRLTGGPSTNTWNITILWLFVHFLSFPFLSFFSCRRLQQKMAEPILTHDSSYEAVLRKEVPFGGLDNGK